MKRNLKGISLCVGFILSMFVLTTCYAVNSVDEGTDTTNTSNQSGQSTEHKLIRKNQQNDGTSVQNTNNNTATPKSPDGEQTDTSY